MSETFKKFSETLKKSPNETLEILKAAGISGKKEGDTISHEEKIQVIQYLNKGKQVSRRQRSTSQLKVMQGKAAKTVSVEVRKKTTYAKAKTTDTAKTPPPSAKKKSKANKTEAKTVRKKPRNKRFRKYRTPTKTKLKRHLNGISRLNRAKPNLRLYPPKPPQRPQRNKPIKQNRPIK